MTSPDPTVHAAAMRNHVRQSRAIARWLNSHPFMSRPFEDRQEIRKRVACPDPWGALTEQERAEVEAGQQASDQDLLG